MKEKFVPSFFNLETGEMKPIPAERLAEMKKEEKELEKKEKSRTIKLKPDATFGDLFNAIDDSEENEELWEIFDENLLDNFEADTVEEILSLRSDQAGKARTTNLLDYLKKHGYAPSELFPIKFEKEKKKK